MAISRQTLPATDSAKDLRNLVGNDPTATFEDDPTFVDSNPTENASSENLNAAATPDPKVVDDEDDEDELEDEDTDEADEDDLEDEDDDDDEDDEDEYDDEDDDEDDVEDADDEDDTAPAPALRV